MTITNNTSQRVLATKFLRTTKGGRWGIFLFILIVLILLSSVFYLVLPITKVTVYPEILTWQDDLPINVSLNIVKTSLATSTIPGRLLEADEASVFSKEKNMVMRSVEDNKIIFLQKDFDEVIDQSIKKKLSADITITKIDINQNEFWRIARSKDLFQGLLGVKINYYYNLPLSSWPVEIKGLDIGKATNVLESKSGVAKVVIDFYPGFLANFSQKISPRGQAITFTLDTGAKTSILK